MIIMHLVPSHMQLIYDVWNTLPQDAIESTINICNVPKKIQKRYNRAMKVHEKCLWKKDDEWKDSDAPFYRNQLPHALEMIGEMKQKIPDYQSKMICDVPLDFRSSEAEWDKAEQNGLTILRY